jgi:tRNA 2-thiouridine synthesizing protein C
MDANRKTILFILQRAPYSSSATREALDAALAAAAFEQRVQLLFTGDGVWNLLPGQSPDVINSKDTSKMLQALSYYDIEEVYADAASLDERQFPAGQMAIPTQPLSGEALRMLVNNADCVIAL